MCRILARTKGMPREEWLALRRQGIGGSDAGAVCGVSPYANALTVYRDKTGGALEKEENESMRQGRDLEEYVAKRFTEATGLKVRRSHAMYQSGEHPFMIADVDRLVVGEDAGLECKTASAYSADKWKDGDIPLHYILQCLHYMIVTGKKAWYLAAVILGREFVCRRIEWDAELAGSLVGIEEAFWNNHVLAGKMPDPDGTEASEEVIRGYFHTAKKEKTVELVGFDEKLAHRSELLEQIEALTRERKQIEQEIKMFMKDNEYAVNENYRVAWSNIQSTRLDTARIKEERPDIYESYKKAVPSRRFEIKAA